MGYGEFPASGRKELNYSGIGWSSYPQWMLLHLAPWLPSPGYAKSNKHDLVIGHL